MKGPRMYLNVLHMYTRFTVLHLWGVTQHGQVTRCPPAPAFPPSSPVLVLLQTRCWHRTIHVFEKNKHINAAISFVSESNGTGVKTEQQLHTAMWTDRGTASAPAAQLLLRPYLTVRKCKEKRSFCDVMACKKKKGNPQYHAQPQEGRKYVF